MGTHNPEEEVAYFLAQIGHELRTPLNAVQGFGTLLKSEAMGPLNKEQHVYLQKILDSSDHLLSIINQIIDWAKLSTGQIELVKTKENVWFLLHETAGLFELLVREKGIELTVEADKDIHVYGDHDRLRQVLINLTNNAIKFTPTGGKITLRSYVKDGYVCIEVVDTGIGIAEDTLKNLFDAFFKSNASENEEGAGLGLWISHEIISQHGGTIDVTSVIDKGTTFSILFPNQVR